VTPEDPQIAFGGDDDDDERQIDLILLAMLRVLLVLVALASMWVYWLVNRDTRPVYIPEGLQSAHATQTTTHPDSAPE